MPGQHAELSPSAGKRWMTCTKSVHLAKAFPNTESTYAAEGTTAHELAEVLIKQTLKLMPPAEQLKILERIQFNNAYYNAEMLRYCSDYRDFVVEAYSEATAQAAQTGHKAEIYIEKPIDVSNVHKDIWGTGDIVIVWPGNAWLIDFKYGQGLPVDAEQNPQLMLYGCGILREFAGKYKIENVRFTIFQPRIDHTNTWATTSAYLMEWAYNKAIPAAKKAINGEGEYVAGEHCRFCPAVAMCRANAEFNMEIAQEEFKDPDLLTADEVSHILLKHTNFTSWIKAVVDYATEQAVAGRQWPGMKLVEGRSVRKYINQAAIIRTLTEDLMFDEEQVTNKELKTISELEALLGKKKFTKYIGENVVKPSGNPTLVPVTHKKPALGSGQSAHDDFEDI